MINIRLKHVSEITKLIDKLNPYFKTHQHFLFDAPMGAGKTTIIKKIGERLGVTDTISSPTYSIVNEYLTRDNTKIFHFDLYRLQSHEELLDIGIDEIIESDSICFFEWPEKILNFLPNNYVWVNIVLKGDTRIVTIEER